MMLTACYSDKGNYDYTAMTPVEVSGIEAFYSRKVSDVNLVIDPTVSNPERFDYSWQIYRDQQTSVLKPDTLALTRKLDMAMDYQLPAGNYRLAFNARDKETGYTKIVQTIFTVTTANSIGWYFTKEQSGRVDIDFYSDSGSTPNWIASFNGGLSLPGKVLETMLLSTYEQVPTDGVTTRSLLVVTDSDAAIFRVNDGGLSRSWDNLFFSVPTSRNIQAVMMPTSYGTAYLTIDGQIYSMTLGVMYGGAPFVGPLALGTARMSQFGGYGMSNVVWDASDKSLKALDGSVLSALSERSEAPVSCNNMGADPVWMECYPYPRWRSLMLMPDKLVEMQTDYQYVSPYGSPARSNPIINSYPIAAGSKMATATVRGGYFDGAVVYLGSGGDLWQFTASDQSESLTWTAPAGEEITLIQHVKWPINVTTPAATDVSKVVVATHNAGRYKIWLATPGAGGLLTMPADPTYEGDGLVKCATWLASPGSSQDGSIVYF